MERSGRLIGTSLAALVSEKKQAVSSDLLVEALDAFAEQSASFSRQTKQSVGKIKSFFMTMGGTTVALAME